MEGAALEMVIEQLRELWPFVETMCTDEDSTTAKLLADNPLTKHVVRSKDAGHKCKNFGKKIKDITGDGKSVKWLGKRWKRFILALFSRVKHEYPKHDQYELRCAAIGFSCVRICR
eukprot:TRINITY_DN4513_c0_g2_i2.p4 TRINITY_DN4513_c0_g2~~TRINITY_DN4513_c0_g2_i2.p4  ORF type:complete len:116 (+),score=19.51 TRINITY_DN4513_c0_g2_i2:1115-1462(+)